MSFDALVNHLIEEARLDERNKMREFYKDYIKKDKCPNCDVQLAMKIRQLKKANKSLQKNNQELRNQLNTYILMR